MVGTEGVARCVQACIALGLMLTGGVLGQPFRAEDGQFPGDVTGVLVMGDLDGDGDVDAISRARRVLYNDGTGRFAPDPTQAPLPGTIWEPETTRLVDIDGDGDLDLFAFSLGGGAWLNDGTGGFSPSLLLRPATLPWSSVTFDDLDGDGDQDAFVAPCTNPNPGCLITPTLWLNDGAGNLADASWLLPAGLVTGTRTPIMLDLDGDGLREIFIAQRITPTPSGFDPAPPVPRMLLVRPSLGDTYAPVAVPSPGAAINSPPTALRGDVNGDGRPDVVVMTEPFLGTEEVYLDDGAGGLSLAGVQPIRGLVRGLALADMDGDARSDLVRFGARGATVRVLGPGATFGTVRFDTTELWGPIGHPVDVDGDGDRDLVVEEELSVRVAFNDGSGRLAPEPSRTPGVGRDRTMADMDGDGDPDLALAPRPDILAAPGVRWSLAVNDGRGGFAVQPAPGLDVRGRHVFFDGDNDGDLDVYESFSGVDRYLRNDGAVGFVLVSTQGGGLQVDAIVPVDVDQDGLTDLVLRRGAEVWGTPVTNTVAINLGPAAGFAAPVPIDAVITACRDLEVFDADGDGDPDLLEANGNTMRLLRNDGAGGFIPAAVPGASFGDVCVAGDLDGDGDVDAIVDSAIWINDGTGAFNVAGTIGFAFPQALSLVDTDLDGDLDLLGVSAVTAFHRVGLGNGSFGAMTTLPSEPALLDDRSLITGDVDGDGDPDVLARSGRWMKNTLRDLSASGLPRPGVPLVLRVDAPPGAAFQLWAAATIGPGAVTPQGQLWLPATAVQVTAGAIPATGGAVFTIPVPNVPAVVGASVHWQAFMPGQGALTTAVTTTF